MDEVTGKMVKCEEPDIENIVEETVDDDESLADEQLETLEEEILDDVETVQQETLEEILEGIQEEKYEVIISGNTKPGSNIEVNGVTYEVIEKEEEDDVEDFDESENGNIEMLDEYETLEDNDLKIDMVEYDEDNMPEYLWSDNETDIKQELNSTGGNSIDGSKKMGGRNKNHICNICGHHVDSPSKLERHMRTHEANYKGRRPVVPGTETDLFGDDDKKKRIRVKKYLCPICKNMFESPNKLKRHMVFHMKSKKVTIFLLFLFNISFYHLFFFLSP
jgi:C2H2-type zinc finger/Zinc finger, C2H2 type